MKNNSKSHKLFWAIKVLIAYFISYLLCQYGFITLHNSKEWPLVLFLFGYVIILIGSFFYLKKLMVSTVAGYIIGFLCGIMFNKDGMDPGGGRTNNAWLIWTFSFLGIVIIGIIWEIIDKCIKSNGYNK
ncbi:hypothetical protein [Lacrimispora sp.]|uniref:hypothetical protein n=1 Tax=Lacrimispora sp. TaxID=2719234 RepID=UPI0028AF6FE5|nr:hypothetical protein [Lacrimispora sp.]